MEVPPSDNLYIKDLPQNIDRPALLALFEPYGTVVDCKVLPARQPEAKASAMVRFSSIEEATWLVENLNGNMPEGLNEPIIVKFANPPTWKQGKGMGPMGGMGMGMGMGMGNWGPYGGDKGGGKGMGGGMCGGMCGGMGGMGGGMGGGMCGGMASMGGGGGGFENWSGGDWSWDGGSGKSDGGKGKNGGKDSSGKGAKPKVAESFEFLLQNVSDKFGAMQAPLENQVYVKGLPSDSTDLSLYRLFSPFGALAPNGVKAMIHPDGTCKGFGFVDFVETASATLAVQQLDGFECPDGNTIHCSIKAPGLKPAGGKGSWDEGTWNGNGES